MKQILKNYYTAHRINRRENPRISSYAYTFLLIIEKND